MKKNRLSKRIFAIVMIMALAGSAQAQLFNIDGMGQNGREKPEGNGPSRFGPGGGNTGGGTGGGGTITPSEDPVSPLGSGIFLLAGMAGAYALARRKDKE